MYSRKSTPKFLVMLSLLSLMFAAGCNKEERLEQPLPDTSDMQGPGQVEPGIVLVKMQAEPEDPMDIAKALPDLKIKSVERMFIGPEKFEARKRAMGLHLWYKVVFDQATPVTRAAAGIEAAGGIDEITYVYPVKLADAADEWPFNDPRLPDQWHYFNNIDNPSSRAGSDINLFPAWEMTTGDPDVIVAVTDGGVDVDHEDLAWNMWVNEAELNGVTGVDDDGNGFVDDIYGFSFQAAEGGGYVGTVTADDHGTHVAGTIAAVNNNGIGVSGIAGGDYAAGKRGASIMSCQTSPGSAYIAEAFTYAADNGAVISQNSWTVGEDYASILNPAIEYFVKYAGMDENGNQVGPMAGGLVVFAAANEASSTVGSYPGRLENVLAVASIGADYEAAYYTNFGSWVDIAATGGDAQKGYQILSTTPDNTYSLMQGTSMAAPHVSGVAALVVSRFGGPGFTNKDLRDILLNTANDIIYDYNPNYKGLLGVGLVDAGECMYGFGPEPPYPVDDLEIVSTAGSNITLQWTVPEDPDSRKASSFSLFCSTSSLAGLDPENPGQDVTVHNVEISRSANPGDPVTYTVTGLRGETTYYFRVQAKDNLGNASELSEEVSESTTSNLPPVITPIDGSSVTLKKHEKATLQFQLSDPDLNPIEWELITENDAPRADTKAGENLVSVHIDALNAPDADVEKTYKAVLVATDGIAETSIDILYTILPNSAPEVTSEPEDICLNKTEVVNMDLAQYFTDPDGEALTYTLDFDSNVISTSNTNTSIRIVAANYGLTTMTITATDASGASASVSVQVLVRDASKAADLFPNPVVDVLNLRPGESASAATVKVLSKGGNTVLTQSFEAVSPFAPAVLDMSSLSGGLYTVIFEYTASNGSAKSITSEISKL